MGQQCKEAEFSVILFADMLWRKEVVREGGRGGEERRGGEEGELGLERCRGGIHVLGPATMGCARKGDGRSVWLVTAGQSA